LTDVWRTSRGRPAGIGVGIAAAIKLTPGIFIVFFLLASRTKAALTAIAAFAGCGLIAYLVAPGASELYWRHLFYDTKRVGAPYISNQSPYGAAIRIADGITHVGAWYPVIPLVLGVIGLAAATVLVRRHDWLGATATTGATGLLVSPISWAHHWVWVLLALVVLRRGGSRSRAAAGLGYALFVLSPLWWTPHSGGPHEYGFHGLLTIVANCYLLAGLAFLAYMAWQAYLTWRTGTGPGAGDRDKQAADVPADQTGPARVPAAATADGAPDRTAGGAAEPVAQGERHQAAADQPAR
jgi:alpha-1,2-mannosyltransferase